jgi:hypothetical protein
MRFGSASNGSLNMRRSTDLLGRDALVRDVADHLAAGRSVLLYGPEAIGKSAIIAALGREDLIVVDPFEHVTRQRAAEIRRALDRGAVYIAASRAANRRALGAAGRILWRFSMVRVRELPDSVVRRIIAREFRHTADRAPEATWIREAASLARGRPGFATAMARFATEWHCRRGYYPVPALAFVAARDDATIESLRRITASPRMTKERM